LVWRSGNGVRHIKEVKLFRPGFNRIGDGLWRVYHPDIYPVHSGPLSLVFPPWVGAMSTGNGFGHLWEETASQNLRPYGALYISL